MSVFKCKMCGGELSPKEGETVVTCPFCGTRQTISTCSDERKTNLFNRANSLRIKNEFDKALLAYQTILSDSPNDAEAHWGATLCRYGIEYVDDPKTGKKIPTCHRASYESILSDSDYEAALANSDVVAREEYRTEAEQISDIQKGILSISQKEDPFDIFVCYKETDEKGDRTPDSVLAQQIYDELVKKGYKVFFSRITLESKLGTAYEPYIFAALNSSKVMLVIGTKPDYFNAVWVKNEWSRFIALMQGKADKFVVPCFRNMDAYDMPEELLGFQSQDMEKIGAMQDLLRGVDKLMGRDAVKTKIETKTTVIQSDVNIEGLLTRAEILIGDGNFEKADELLEKVLNNDPKNVKAYVLKMLEGFKLASVDEISSLDSPIDDDYNFKKAYQFADTEERKTLDGYNQSILDRLENERLERLYQNALEFKNKGLYIEAVTSFSGLVGYKDSDKQLAECTKLGKEGLYKHALSAKDLKNYDEAITVFEKIQDFQDSKDQIEFCKKAKEDARKEAIYGAAILPDDIDLLNEMKKAEDSVSAMRSISGYKDSDSLAARYQEKIDSFKAEQKRLAEEKAKQAKIKKDKFKLFLKIFLPCLAFVVGMILLTTLYIVPEVKFTKAVDMINSGDYDNAIEVLTNIGSFNDAPNQIKMAEAGKSFKSGDYETGIDYIYNLGGTVNVNYDGNGGTPDRDSSTIKKGKYIDDTSSRGGYTFYGWVLDQYQLHAAKDSYGADIKLKASYEPITYTITFDLNGGTSDSLPKTYTMDVVCDIPNPSRIGYSFTGWTGTGLSDLTKDLSLPAGTMGNKSYRANWKANEYYIHYDPAGGKISSAAQKVVFDSSYTLLSTEQGGYDFLGWFDSTGTQFQTSGVWKKASDVYLTAKWQAINYTITYYLDGGTNSPLNKTSYTISASAIILSDPSKTGYTFDGWTGNGTNSPTKSLKIEAGTYGNLSFTAHWNANQYAVAFDPNGGVVDPATATYTYDSNATLPTPTRVGYAFAGWYNGTTEVSSGVWKNANDVTLTAHWTANTDTKYVVNYYQQDIYDDNYALAETQAMVGTTDTSVTPYVRTYEGFTSPSAQTVNVTLTARRSSIITTRETNTRCLLCPMVGLLFLTLFFAISRRCLLH
jgi:uncharacterized repeat protein (TIGR02543 family)